MKATFTATSADLATDTSPSAWSPRALLDMVLARARQTAAERSLRRQLAGLDDAVLRDIGISEDEIWRLRSNTAFTPQAWL